MKPRLALLFVLAFLTCAGHATDYFVSTNGNDSNNGLTLTGAWRTLRKALRLNLGGMSNGTVAIPNMLYVQPGVYESETTGATSGTGSTNWFLDLSNRQYIQIVGAGPTQTILKPGTKTLDLSIGNDGMPSRPLFKIFNAKGVRVSGMYIDGTTPPTKTQGAGYPNHCCIVGIQSSSDIRIDHLYLNGIYTGRVYNVAITNWQNSWQGWWYHAICINGVLGPGIQIDHVLTRGFVRSVYNNNFGSGANTANTNIVLINHCTFVENVCVSDATQVVNARVIPTEYGPSFDVRNCIISDHPLPSFDGSTQSEGLLAQGTASMSNPNFIVSSQNNQFWAVGKPIPGSNFKNANIVDFLPAYTDYENEQPLFVEDAGLPYSTDRNTINGFRDVGWHPFGEAPPDPAPGDTNVVLGLWLTTTTISVVNNGGSNFPYQVTTPTVWIKLNPAFTNGTVTSVVSLPFTVSRAALGPGSYHGSITVTCGALATFVFQVSMQVATPGIPYVYGLHVTQIVPDAGGNKYYQDTMIQNTTPRATFDSCVDVGVLTGFFTFGNTAFTDNDPYLAANASSTAPAQYTAQGSFTPPSTNLANNVRALGGVGLLNPVVNNGSAPIVNAALGGYVSAASLSKQHLNMPLAEGVNRFTLLCPAAGEIENEGMIGLFLLEGGTLPAFKGDALPTVAAIDDPGAYDAIGLDTCGFRSGDATYSQKATNTFTSHTLTNIVGAYEVAITYFNIAGFNDPVVNPYGMTGPGCVGYVCDYVEDDYNNQWCIRPADQHAVGFLELSVTLIPEPAALALALLLLALPSRLMWPRRSAWIAARPLL
jgi:hypothetical protein